MAGALVESADSTGKPKKLLDKRRDVRKTRPRFQESKANVVEALVPSAYFSGSVLDTTPINREQAAATPGLSANIGH